MADAAFSKKEWMRKVQAAAKAQLEEARAAEDKGRAKRAPAEAPAPRPAPAQDMRGGEGTRSTQGERAAEHAAHQKRMREEEAEALRAAESVREARQLKLEELRGAVVMSEVLGKPVALRPRNPRRGRIE